MTKKLVFSVIALAMAVSPFLSVKADDGDWDAAISAAAWSYDDYRVERLAFDEDVEGPFNLGDFAVIAEPVDSCEPNDCGLYDVTFMQDGFSMHVANVPEVVLNDTRFASNSERFVFISQIDWDGDHYAVTEYDTDGSSEQLVEDVFFSGAEEIDVLVDDDELYFNTALDYTGDTVVHQAGVYVWDEAGDEADIIGKHYELRDETLLDAEDGVVLIKMEFESGNKQLWLGDTANVDHLGMTREAIAGTWVDDDADIYAAHFVSESEIEFFMNFIRYTYDLDTEVLTKHDGQYLNWYRDAEDAYQIVNGVMAWVDSSDTLYLSMDGTVQTIGTATDGQFLLEDDRIFYASGSEGKMYDFDSESVTSIPFAVTDSDGDDVVVGLDATGSIWYLNLDTEESYELGFGSAPVLSDNMHVYWMGVDGDIYEGTVSLPSAASAGSVRALKSSTSNTVYLIMDGKAYSVPSEKTYFTWFDSWSDVELVSTATITGYASGGTATLAPGTKVKIANDVKVYVVGDDGKLHWIVSQTVAYSIYGSSWNQGILEISQQDLVTNSLGTTIQSERDVQSI